MKHFGSRTFILASVASMALMLANSGNSQNAGASSGYPVPADSMSPTEQQGHGLYLRYCVGCHGVRGDGNGENAPYLEPRPRDFTAATFKCRSTPTGSLPLDSDLIHTLERGIQASNMPSWYTLTPQNREALVAYIKLFSPRWKKEHPTPISVPPETAVTAQSVRHGHELFEKMECWKCHGQEGRGDGPSSSTLTDSKDRPITPYDFTHGERFKCGETNKDLYTIFMTGVDGTPMPSFADNLKPEEAWDIVHYLRALQPRKSAAREIAKSIGLKPGPIDQPAGDQPNPPATAQPSGAESAPQQAPTAEPSSSAPDNSAQPSAPTTAPVGQQQPSNSNSPR